MQAVLFSNLIFLAVYLEKNKKHVARLERKLRSTSRFKFRFEHLTEEQEHDPLIFEFYQFCYFEAIQFGFDQDKFNNYINQINAARK